MERPLKILHLEDLKTDSELVKRQIEKSGLQFSYFLADTREDFKNALQQFNPDIILSDHSLTAFDSVEALGIAKKIKPEIPFILITATVSEEFAVRIMKEGAWDYILKDRMERLPNAIFSALEKYNLLKNERRHLQDIINSEALFKKAESIAHFGICRYNFKTKKITLSDEACRIFGFKPGSKEVTFKTILRSIFPEDIPHIKYLLKNKILNSPTISTGCRILQHTTKNIRYINARFASESKKDRDDLTITGFIQDITEQKIAEELLATSEADLRSILNATSTAYVLFNNELEIRSFNKAANEFSIQYFGKAIVAGSSCLLYFPPGRHARINETIQKVKEGKNIHYEANYTHEDGKENWFAVEWFGVANPEKAIIGIIASFTDITEKKLLEIEKEKIHTTLIHRNKDLEEFTQVISHNLRAPLANILELIGVCKLQKWEIDQEKEKIMSMIESSAVRIDSVIKNINDVVELRTHTENKRK